MAKTIVGKILKGIANLFKGLNNEVKKFLPVAVIAVNAVKYLIVNPVPGSVFDAILKFIKNSIKGELDDVLIDKIHKALHENLPKLLLNLKMLDQIENTIDPIEKADLLEAFLKDAFSEFKWSTDEAKRNFYDGLMKLIAESISDGKITWKELSGLSKYTFDNLDVLK